MNRLKRPISFLLMLLLLLSAAAAAPIAADASSGWSYEYTSDHEGIKITGLTGSDAEVVIPSTIEGLPVKIIDYGVFMNNTAVEAVTIPSGVTHIGYEVFKGCSNLKSISIPDTVTSIGDAFVNCTSLEEIVIPPSVTSIHSEMFNGCSNLKKLTINGGLLAYTDMTTVTDLTVTGTEIALGNYKKWTSLQKVTISDSVTSIGQGAFEDLTNLTSVTIGSGVTTIGPFAFDRCTALTSITIPSSVTSLGQTFSGCTGLVTADIQANITSITYNMFSNCTNLKNVTIPETVTEIKGSAFEGCNNITHLTIPKKIYNMPDILLSNVTDLTITGTTEGATIGQFSFQNRTNLQRVTVQGNVTEVEYAAFEGCTNLTSVILGSNVNTVAVAFSGCSSLKSLTILNRNASINSNNARGTNLPNDNFTLYGYIGSTTESFSSKNAYNKQFNFVPVFDTNTGDGSEPASLDDKMTVEDDGNQFGLNLDSYNIIELLGVQEKTDAGTNNMRFVAVINQGLVAQISAQDGDITDYGFVIAKCSETSTSSASDDIETVTKGAVNTTCCSCAGTSNNICGDYGIYDDTTTKYKYVTLAVNDVPDNQGFVVRFYVETSSGKTYYANYNSVYTGCATSYSNFAQLKA